MSRLLTVPDDEDGAPAYLPTGNEYLALPLLRPDGAVEACSVLHMQACGLIELAGEEGGRPLIAPLVEVAGQPVTPALRWQRAHDWVPAADGGAGPVRVSLAVLAPVGHKGALLRLEVTNAGRGGSLALRFGWHGCWARTLQTIYTPRPVSGVHAVRADRWSGGAVFEVRTGTALIGWAVTTEHGDAAVEWRCEGRDWGTEPLEVSAGVPIEWRAVRELELPPGRSATLTLVLAVNREADGARTTAVDLRRRGFAALYEETAGWLAARALRLSGEGADLTPRCNLNLWFNYFYAQGLTIDSEERVLVTSRSPLYYVSAAFWARDALLWSFPALLLVDRQVAREALLAAFGRYFRHAGIHSLYMDGRLLYPGFELDELAAYAVAVERFVRFTGDAAILDEPAVAAGLAELEDRLAPWAHPDVPLYATFLYPSDDPAHHPYTTYGNALVWRMLRFLARVHDRAGRQARAAAARQRAAAVRDAVYRHLVADGPFGPMFAYAADLKGRHVLYDEPPGSLQLLAYYGFCAPTDPVYRNTVRWIRSPNNPYAYDGAFPGVGCPHAEHPFVMDVFNGLLSGERERPLAILRSAPLDGGLACESFDRETGSVRTGRAFATCAGFLAYAMAVAWGGVPGLEALEDREARRADPAGGGAR